MLHSVALALLNLGVEDFAHKEVSLSLLILHKQQEGSVDLHDHWDLLCVHWDFHDRWDLLCLHWDFQQIICVNGCVHG